MEIWNDNNHNQTQETVDAVAAAVDVVKSIYADAISRTKWTNRNIEWNKIVNRSDTLNRI